MKLDFQDSQQTGKQSTARMPSAHQVGGGRRIRTSEAEAADLQSAPFDRSGIPPKPSGELSYAAVQGVNTPDTRIVEERKLIGEII